MTRELDRMIVRGGNRGISAPAAVPAVVSPRRRSLWRRREHVTGWLYVAPAIAVFLVFGAYPLGYGLALSFAQWNGLSPDWTWVGFDNYTDILGGRPIVAKQVWDATWVTIVMIVSIPLLTIAVSFPLAVMLNGIKRLRGFLRTLYFLPYVTAGVAVLYAWRYVFDVDGVLNSVLRGIGLGALAADQGLLGSPDTALIGVIVVIVWTLVPLGILLYFTGLQTIDESLIEAALVDGAGRWRIFRSILAPLLAPTTALIAVLGVQNALQNFFAPLILTNGGPFGATTSLSMKAYQLAFAGFPNLGYASALGWILFLAGVTLAIVNLRLGRKRD